MKFSSQVCSKDFSEEYKLRRHIKEVHEGLKDHVCATCGKGFARADKLFQHELVHVPKSDRPVEWVPIRVSGFQILSLLQESLFYPI